MALNGNEILYVQGIAENGKPAATTERTTTGAIAALASTESSPFISTPIATVGNGVLTAAGLVGGQILRTGPTGNYTDTTASAAQIVAALPGFIAGETFSTLIKNATAFTQTLQAGGGITLPTTVIIPPFSVANYIIAVNTATTATFTHIDTTPISTGAYYTAPSITSLNTVGNGTILAANFVGGYTARSGSQSGTPFTDTTDIATAILAANASLVNKIGTAVPYFYANTTNALATLQGGTGVTVSGVTTVPAGMVAYYLLTYTAAATITMVGIGLTNNISTAMALAGSSSGQTILQAPAVAGGTVTLPTITSTLAINSPAPVLAGATLAVTAAISNSPILLNTASGSVATLPAATGSGNKYSFIVSTSATSNAHKILAASSSDFLIGRATGSVAAGTTLQFSSPAATNHSIQMPFAGTQPSGGIIGDKFDFIDIAANLWEVTGQYESGTTSTTPFSSATS